jgi:hypothetical protein
VNLVGAVVIPSAPILVPGMSEAPPAELDAVRDAVAEAVAALPPHHLLLLLSGAWADGQAGVYGGGVADLGGLGRPDLVAGIGGFPFEAERVAALAGLPQRQGPLPVDLAALALLAWPAAERVGAARTLPVALAFADAVELAEAARGIDAALEPIPFPVAAVVAGDLAAGHTARSPRHVVAGSQEWDAAAVRAVTMGVWKDLADLGPGEARRVGARGWPALVALGALLADAHAAMEIRYSGAPRGVGCLVATV